MGNNGTIISSTDLGINWVSHSDVTNKQLNAVVLKPDNSIFIGGNNGAMFRYSDEISAPLSHFQKIWSGNPYLPMNIYITSASIDSIPLNQGDEIAVFSGSACVGFTRLNNSIPPNGFVSIVASMDDPTTPEIDGFLPNDTIVFKLWDSDSQTEIEFVQVSITQGSGLFSQQGTLVAGINGRTLITQVIGLTGGWNIISLNSEPLNKNLLDIFSNLISNETLIKVQDETGNAIEKLPPPIGWINNIGNWSVTEGYYTKIKPDVSAALINTGFKINMPLIVPLSSGWNILSYPLTTAMNAMDVLNDLIINGKLIKVQDEAGNAIEHLPEPIGWINNIGNFSPGEGYYIKVNQDAELVYNQSSGKLIRDKQKIIPAENYIEQFNTIWSGNPYLPMNIYFTELNNLSSDFLKAGDEIGIFDGDICVGAKQLSLNDFSSGFAQIISSADDPTTDIQDGFITGHNIRIRKWNNETGEITEINSVTFLTGNGLFEPLGTAIIRFDSVIPVEIKSFSAAVVNNSVELFWETASEMNNKGFEVERSKNIDNEIKSWESVNFINGNGTSSEIKKYYYKDADLSAGKYSYRLKQIDFDGAFKYSDEIAVEIKLPDNFSLEQNYPNPFNPTTKISWQSPVAGRQTLKVFDVLGKEVATLIDEYRGAGIYEIEFNVGQTSSLSSGVYFYQLRIENTLSDSHNGKERQSFIGTRKMLLMK